MPTIVDGGIVARMPPDMRYTIAICAAARRRLAEEDQRAAGRGRGPRSRDRTQLS